MAVWKQKKSIIDDIIALSKKSRVKGGGVAFGKFVEAFFATVTPDAVAGQPPKDLFAMAENMWNWVEKRPKKKALVRVFNPSEEKDGWYSRHTVVQIATDDSPFIVDSVTAGLAVTRRQGINAVYHPVVMVERDKKGSRQKIIGKVGLENKASDDSIRESYMHLELDTKLIGRELKDLEKEIQAILDDVRISVEDWRTMLARAEEAIGSLRECPPPQDPEGAEETCKFIAWLIDNNFTFLGYREYHFKGDPKTADFKAARGSGLGLLRDPKRHILRGAKGLTAISPEIRDFLSTPDPIIITKANVKTRVHRPVHLDYIGVKIFDKKGCVVGERRFVGLFTSVSYARRAEEVPLIRRKLAIVQRRAFYEPTSHAGKALSHILDTFPRDELFQIGEDQLLEMCLGIQHLMERPRPRVFARADKFERFVSALVYVPRENYNSNLRVEIGDILAEAFNGEISVYYAQLSDVTLARWHFIIRTKPGTVPTVDMDEVNTRIEHAAKPWTQHLREKLIERNGEKLGLELARKYERVFPLGYREAFLPHRAASDVLRMETLTTKSSIRFEIYRLLVDPTNSVRLKIYHASETVPLSECLPRLEHLGLRVIAEHAYEVRGEFGGCVHDFYMETADGADVDVEAVDPLVEHLLAEIWANRIEDDALNALCLHTGLPAEKIVILRTVGKYLRQIGLSFSQNYVHDCMVRNGKVSVALVELFEALLDPAGPGKKDRLKSAKAITARIRAWLDEITSLDDDRILRSYLSVILAILRTNFYQPAYITGDAPGGNAPGLAIKIRSKNVPLVPKPRPFAEIFVYSPKFEGVHLRGGPVARGGLRWSDRPEDFRTEILGLAKAQMVKNSVIVPVGAKGGFVPKGLPSMKEDRNAFIEGGTACYKSFITSLLSVTDNLKGGRTIAPKKVMRWDDSDPYLVVAADKGTATFSDTANGIAIDHGFWLGDAFASGGSVGYDHKKMGITARGAWVSVERHFREVGVNIAKDPITVIGIGDMSGDVFGNGMLLSKALKLQIAFNHMHIFFDPDPDPAKSFEERKRLFKLPRSGWSDYKTKLISEGGGVFERSAKSITLTPQLKAFLGVDVNELTPNEVIHHALSAKADLLWIGGIGTYVKGQGESHADAGDRANDAVRINGRDLKVKVVGEGGNLGMTQLGRIEFARKGGRLNTDFVDNSAGVDCSDKEVNIKILLADAVDTGLLAEKERVALLAQMTKEVGLIVLEDNYLQTQAISIAESQAVAQRDQHLGLIRVLEREKRLDREIEFLPSDDEFSSLALQQQGLTRPEIAVVVSYAKMSLFDILLQSPLLDSKVLQPELEWGFPRVLVDKYSKQLGRHQLRREIVATTLANEIVNRAGVTFVHDVKEETGLAVDQIAAAFLIVRDAFGLEDVWHSIDKLDYKISAAAQTHMHVEISHAVKKQATWFLRNMPKPLDITGLVEGYSSGLRTLIEHPEGVLSPLAMADYKTRVSQLKGAGVPRPLARTIAGMEAMTAASDIVNAAGALGRKVNDVGTAYFEVGHRVGFDWLRQQTESIFHEDNWDKLAVHAIADDLASMQRELTKSILSAANGGSGAEAVKKWMGSQKALEVRAARLIDELKSSGPITVAKLSFAARHIRSILPT